MTVLLKGSFSEDADKVINNNLTARCVFYSPLTTMITLRA